MSEANGAHLRSFIERIERLIEEKQTIQEDIKEVYAEVKGNGYTPKIVRMLIRKRAKDRAELEEEETLLDLYERAVEVGMGE